MARLKINMSYFVAATTILLVMVGDSVLPNYVGIFQMSFACNTGLFSLSQSSTIDGQGSMTNQTINISHEPGRLPPISTCESTALKMS